MLNENFSKEMERKFGNPKYYSNGGIMKKLINQRCHAPEIYPKITLLRIEIGNKSIKFLYFSEPPNHVNYNKGILSVIQNPIKISKETLYISILKIRKYKKN